MKKTLVPALGLIMSLLLAACAGGEHDDLRLWMEENSRDLRGRVDPLPEVKPYEPIPYEVADQVDPFQSSKIEPTSRRGPAMLVSSSLISRRAICVTACWRNIRWSL